MRDDVDDFSNAFMFIAFLISFFTLVWVAQERDILKDKLKRIELYDQNF
jgi:hypothetical protein